MNTTYDIVILTDKRYLKDSKTDTYKHNVFYEDYLVQEALIKEGLNTLRLAWDDSDFDWATTKSILFRTTWDYFDRFNEFSEWLQLVSQKTQLLNSEHIIKWNVDKHYLNELKQKKVHVAETFFIEQGSSLSLKSIHKQLGWNDTVLKPCISGAGRHTYKLSNETLNTYEPIFKSLILKESMMLQPFQYQIIIKGEISMILINGKYTHAILKKAKAGDFRVQDDFGGSVHDYNPSKEEIAFAENAINACPELPVYARVDIFTDNDNKIALSELELIEPELWFRYNPDAAIKLAKAIKLKL
jgi:glutathione synthase/RimK-type ligase-like ATP-grasp enzyme